MAVKEFIQNEHTRDAFDFLRNLRDELKNKNHIEAVKHLEFLLQGAGAFSSSERVIGIAMGLGSFLEKYGHLIDDSDRDRVLQAKKIYHKIFVDPSKN